MKNPLRKRLLRELKSEFGKYMVIFLLLVGSIGFVSGFLVADGSMIAAYEESFEKYNIEDGNFLLEEKLENGSTLRVFRQRDQVNRVCLMDGELPEQSGEIAIDRMYGENNGIEIGAVLRGKRIPGNIIRSPRVKRKKKKCRKS